MYEHVDQNNPYLLKSCVLILASRFVIIGNRWFIISNYVFMKCITKKSELSSKKIYIRYKT